MRPACINYIHLSSGKHARPNWNPLCFSLDTVYTQPWVLFVDIHWLLNHYNLFEKAELFSTEIQKIIFGFLAFSKWWQGYELEEIWIVCNYGNSNIIINTENLVLILHVWVWHPYRSSVVWFLMYTCLRSEADPDNLTEWLKLSLIQKQWSDLD